MKLNGTLFERFGQVETIIVLKVILIAILILKIDST